MSKISVVIPAYNASEYIENCINSLLEQSYGKLEIIVVNDGSKDNTLEILNRFAKKDERIIIVDKENGGVSSARNEGLKRATGEYVTFVDADDTCPKDAIKNMISLMRDDVDLVVCSHNEIRISSRSHLHEDKEITREELNERFRELDRVIWWPWGKLFRRSVIENNSLGYDTSLCYGEDHIFNIVFAKHMSGRAVISSKIAYNYHYMRGGLASRYYPDMHKLQKYIYGYIVDFFGGEENMPEKYRGLYSNSYLRGAVEYYLINLKLDEACDKIKECFEVYEDVIYQDTIGDYFTPDQLALAKDNEWRRFAISYMKSKPKETVLRKIKSDVKAMLSKI